MARAIQLARNGIYSSQPNPRVGCVIVSSGKVVGEGSHLKAGQAHAEIVALEQAGSAARDATCYVTLEPCVHTGRTSPCASALVTAGIGKVIAAVIDPNPRVSGRGLACLEAAGISTRTGLMEQQTIELNRGFFRRMQQRLPWVTIKMAMSTDGRIALANGQSQWITGTAARSDVQRLRASSCAILSGIGTVISDNPRLNVREVDTLGRQPLRVIVDRKLRTPPDARLFQSGGPVLIYTESDQSRERQELENSGAEIILLPAGEDFLHAALQDLAGNREVNNVMVEAGAGLTGALLDAGLVNELVVYQAPLLLGDSARGPFGLKPLEELQEGVGLLLKDVRHLGSDLRLTYNIGGRE